MDWRVEKVTMPVESTGEAQELEDAMLDEFVEMFSSLSETQIKALVHARVPSSSERRTFESSSDGVSRETLKLLAGRFLVRQKLKTIPPNRG
jgi:hypothetical protein